MTKFDEETRQKLLIAIRKGATYQIACDYACLDFSNFWRWMKRGKEEKDSEYSKFRKDIKEAASHTALVWLDRIDDAMKEQWQAAAWKLERRYYKDYSANPVVREEFKNMERDIKQLKKLHGATNNESSESNECKAHKAS